MRSLHARWHHSIKEIPNSHWKALEGQQKNPFYQLKWLAALEETGNISINKGWQPLHLALWRNHNPVALAPLYLKIHSYGEFVFDHTFAQLAGDLGLHYYPKLIGMSPFSPIQGYRFFIVKEEDSFTITELMLKTIDDFAIKNNILSCNLLYVDPLWRKIVEKLGWNSWINKQSIWQANGKQNFSDYLSTFNSNQRRNIKRERNSIKEKGIKVTAITAADIDVKIMKEMHSFYKEHCEKWGIWGSKYLSESFFIELSEKKHRDQIILFSAHREHPKHPIAMSLCITNNHMLWGRYWGSKEEIENLHFEVCYYSPIDWALNNGIQSFDPGAGGSHKGRRGFHLKGHASVHRWYDQRMESLIQGWLPKANKIMIDEIKTANNELPFKISNNQTPFQD